MNGDHETADPTINSIDRALLTRLLTDLDDALTGQPPVALLVVGGAAVMQLVDHRTSVDVDVAHPTLNQHVLVAATQVAERHNVRTDWLNDRFRVAYPNASDALAALSLTPIYEGTNLTVRMPPVQELQKLKLMAARPQDLSDLAELMAVEAPERTVDEWVTHFEAMFHNGLLDKERAHVRSAATQAQHRAADASVSTEHSTNQGTREWHAVEPVGPMASESVRCDHPIRTGFCRHLVTPGKRCSAGHLPKYQRQVQTG